MKASHTTALTLGSICLAFGFAAHAGTSMSDSAKITNGSTGFIGVTQSVGQPRAMLARSGFMAAGEASTMVNGQPNANPDAPMNIASATASDVRQMGASSAMSYSSTSAAARNPSWGTPD